MVGCKQISPHIHVELLLVIILGKPTAISRLTVKTNQFSRLKYNVLLSLAYYYTLECRLIAHWSQRRHKDSFTYVDITSNLTDTVLRCRAACTVRILPQKFIAYPDTIYIYIYIDRHCFGNFKIRSKNALFDLKGEYAFGERIIDSPSSFLLYMMYMHIYNSSRRFGFDNDTLISGALLPFVYTSLRATSCFCTEVFPPSDSKKKGTQWTGAGTLSAHQLKAMPLVNNRLPPFFLLLSLNGDPIARPRFYT